MAVIQRLIDVKQQLHAASADPREKRLALVAQLGVVTKGKLAAVRRELALQLRRLEEQLAVGTSPGAGYREVQRVLWALERAQLPREDPLAFRAWQLIGRWETSNVALRDKAKLSVAVDRTNLGFNKRDRFAGQRLGSALIEVRVEGCLGDTDLVDAQKSLTKWQDSRVKEAREDLRVASFYGDELSLKDAIALCRESGVSEEELAPAVAQYQKLRWTQEVTKKLEDAIESLDAENVERAVAFAHSLNFVEKDMLILKAATLIVHLQFWNDELTVALQREDADGLMTDVQIAQTILNQSEAFLMLDRQREGMPPDLVFDELEEHTRALKVVLPSALKFADLIAAEDELERVLGAVERYAAELPRVIEQGTEKEANILLIAQAEEYLKAYEKTIADLRQAIDEHSLSESAEDLSRLKDAMIKARMAGAPEDLVQQANDQIQKYDEDLFNHSQKELELRIALAEADDIKEKSIEDRFLRLQDAADAARALDPPVDAETLGQIDETSVALAAERTLMLRKSEAEAALLGGDEEVPSTASSSRSSRSGSRSGSRSSRKRKSGFKTSFNQRASVIKMATVGEQLEDATAALRTAITAAEMSALEEAKKVIPQAEALLLRLEEEAPLRKAALKAAFVEAKKWRGKVGDLRDLIIAARQASVSEVLLDDAYTELNARKLDFIIMDLKGAVADKMRALAVGLSLRGRILRGFAREGAAVGANLMHHIAYLCPSAEGVLTFQGMIRGARSGGVFGSQTWRKNPRFVIRQVPEEKVMTKTNSMRRQFSESAPVRVCVAMAEGSAKLATLAVHVVRNGLGAAACGCGEMLMPGFETLIGSRNQDDFPYCEFELPPPSETDKRPVFIVPSAAKGEEGIFTLVICATSRVEVTEVITPDSKSWPFEWSTQVKWCDERPFAKACGGGRVSESAPLLSWYRNPQFRVRIAPPEKDDEDEGEKSMAADWPFAAGEAGEPQSLEAVDEKSENSDELEVDGKTLVAEPPPKTLLQAVLVPQDQKQRKVPVAVHIVRNLTGKEECVEENSMLHALLASSSTADAAYSIASEVGTVCALPPVPPDREDGLGEPVFVVPSLETKDLEGEFKLNFISSVNIEIERVN